MRWSHLQKVQGEWAGRNFPDTTADDVFAGIVEEVGELAMARVSAVEAIEETGDPVEAIADEKDAIGDVVIYLLDYCNRRGLSIAEILAPYGHGPYVEFFQEATEMLLGGDQSTFPCLVGWVGKLAHARLKAKQGIRGDEDHAEGEKVAILMIASLLADYCTRRKWSFSRIVEATWDHVSARDWAANKVDGKADPDYCPRDECDGKAAARDELAARTTAIYFGFAPRRATMPYDN